MAHANRPVTRYLLSCPHSKEEERRNKTREGSHCCTAKKTRHPERQIKGKKTRSLITQERRDKENARSRRMAEQKKILLEQSSLLIRLQRVEWHPRPMKVPDILPASGGRDQNLRTCVEIGRKITAPTQTSITARNDDNRFRETGLARGSRVLFCFRRQAVSTIRRTVTTRNPFLL